MTAPADKKATAKKKRQAGKTRVGSEDSSTRLLILNATEQLMLREGYGAVSSRRVAKDAGLKPPLVHYYFPTTEDLFLAVYRRAVAQEQERLDVANTSQHSLQAIWDIYTNATQTALSLEFMALANHRKSIKSEIAKSITRSRRRRAKVLSEILASDKHLSEDASPAGLAVMMIGIARTLVMEQGLGVSFGHKEARLFVERWLKQLDNGSS